MYCEVRVVTVRDVALEVTRWSRWGQHRLFFHDESGTQVGWYDEDAQRVHAEEAEATAEIAAWLASRVDGGVGVGPPGPQSTSAPEHAPDPVGETEDGDDEEVATWTDLAENRPGEGPLARASEERERFRRRAPFRHRLSRVLDVPTDERAWRLGGQGEVTIGGLLEKLTEEGWFVLHSVPLGAKGADVDHLLIGPGGVYCINTKNHPGKKIWVAPNQIRVNGTPCDYLAASRRERDRVRKVLGPYLSWELEVRPVLVLLTGSLIPKVTIR